MKIDNVNSYQGSTPELKHLLTCNFINNKFNRVDVLVIKYSIEQYLKNEKYDFYMYTKMQIYRGNQQARELVIPRKESRILIKRIKELIKSLEEKGIIVDTQDATRLPLSTTHHFVLVNGAHRLAYMYLKKITPISVRKEVPECQAGMIEPYDIEWFKKRFSTNDLEIINNEVDELEKYLKND